MKKILVIILCAILSCSIFDTKKPPAPKFNVDISERVTEVVRGLIMKDEFEADLYEEVAGGKKKSVTFQKKMAYMESTTLVSVDVVVRVRTTKEGESAYTLTVSWKTVQDGISSNTEKIQLQTRSKAELLSQIKISLDALKK